MALHNYLGVKTMRPLLKLCGNHSANDEKKSLQSTCEYIGFVFAKSKRQVTNEQVQLWLRQNPPNETKRLVALFVNASIDEIEAAIFGLPIDIIQCHGNESVNELKLIKEKINKPIWKAIHHSDNSLDHMKSYAEVADGYVVDCKVGDQWGGTGVSFNWDYVPMYIEEGKRQRVPVFIAGGIHYKNVDKLLPYNPDGI